jgi:predicted RNA-binding protein YlqC (UPF0109 family)
MSTRPPIQPEAFSQFVYRLASLYVSAPDRLRVTAEWKEAFMLVSIPPTFEKTDFPKLIGTAGKNYRALLTLLKQFGHRHQVPVKLEVQEPLGSRVQSKAYVVDPNWQRDEEMRALCEQVCRDIWGFHLKVVFCQRTTVTTTLEIQCDTGLDPTVVGALATIFHAIGKNHGHDIIITAQTTDAVHPQ